MDNLTIKLPIIIILDVDNLLFAKLEQITELGLDCVEINSYDKKLLNKALQAFPNLHIGAGNILNTTQLEYAYEAGVKFITSPGFLSEIAQTANIYSINYLPGIATISEAMLAMSLGCQHVRPFPANLAFCTMLNKYLARLKLYPAEIELEEIEHFLSLPSVNAISVINPELQQLHVLRSFLVAETA